MKSDRPPPGPPPSVSNIEDPVTASKWFGSSDYLKITEEQLKASSPGKSQTEDQTQTQEPLQPPAVQSQPEDDIVEEGSVLVEKFASVEIYNKARLLLELIHMEFIGGEARDNGLLVAGQIKIYV
ncbi:unnamed protein product [Brassica rapa subsp. narinosa]